MPQHVTVTAYDPRWPQLYEREAAAISAALGGALAAIHHIGSTAVPGLAAKPIIDIMPVVHSLSGADAARGALEALGYEYLGEFGIPGRRYLRVAATSARIRCTSSPRGTGRTSPGTWPSATTCARTRTCVRNTPRSSAPWPRAIPTTLKATATARRDS